LLILIIIYALISQECILKNEFNIHLLLHRICENGDEIAFQELFEIYGQGLLRFTNSILRNNELAEEVVSDVFFMIWVNRGKMLQVRNFKAYIFTTARNIALDCLSKERRIKVIILDDISVSLPIDEICPESELISKELKEAIDRAIDHLPERCKLIYSLAKIEQLKYKEISQILDISIKTIDHQLTIAIKKIGLEIKQYLEQED